MSCWWRAALEEARQDGIELDTMPSAEGAHTDDEAELRALIQSARDLMPRLTKKRAAEELELRAVKKRAAQVEGDHREAVAVVKRLETTMSQLKQQTATLSKPMNRRRTLLNALGEMITNKDTDPQTAEE